VEKYLIEAMPSQYDTRKAFRKRLEKFTDDYNKEAERLGAGTFPGKNHCPAEAKTSVRLSIYSGVLVVKNIYITSKNLDCTKIYKDIFSI
jgi:hypothetical protein